jgi:tetratricopeptide (TPR) repeat protein
LLRIAAIATMGCFVFVGWSWLFPSVELPGSVSLEEYRNAERQFRERYEQTPSRIDVLSLIGEQAIGDDRYATALECFREIPSEDPKYGLAARLQEAQVLVRLNRIEESETSFRKFLSLADTNPSVSAEHLATARKWMYYILSVELQTILLPAPSHLAFPQRK